LSATRQAHEKALATIHRGLKSIQTNLDMLSSELPQWRSTAALLAYFSSVADIVIYYFFKDEAQQLVKDVRSRLEHTFGDLASKFESVDTRHSKKQNTLDALKD
jgi:hypothetical protein